MSRKRLLEFPSAREVCKNTPWLSSMHEQQPISFKLFLRKLELYYCRGFSINVMDWINCNTCCRQPGDERERTFDLSSCGHIFCDLCLARAESRSKCGVCSSQCQLIQLSSKMKPDAEMYFLEPAALLKRHFTQVNRLLEFQKDHRVRLVSFHRKVFQKYKALEKQHASVTSHMQELEKRYSTATKRIQELEIENQKLRSMISCQGSAGRMSPVGICARKTSPKQVNGPQVPFGGTRISPGRLTLVRASQESALSNQSPTKMPVATPPPVVYSSVQGTRTPVGQFSPPVPYHGNHQHQVLHVNGSSITPKRQGVGCYRSTNPSPSRTPSPMRSVSGSMNQLALVPPSDAQSANPCLKPGQLAYSSHPSSGFRGSYPDLQAVRPVPQTFTSHANQSGLTPPNTISTHMRRHPSYGTYNT